MSKDNGGHAFPLAFEDATSTPGTHVQYGMTLRDYFAAKANPAELNVSSHDAANLVGRVCPFDSAGKIQWLADVHAELCWKMADAMLKARAQ